MISNKDFHAQSPSVKRLMKVGIIFASNSQVVMNIRIMLFIVMMMVMPVSYAACYGELSAQHNLVVQGILR